MGTLQPFLADVTRQTAEGLIAAVERLPDNRINWQPESGSRSALDQVAECVLLTDYVVAIVKGEPDQLPSFEAYISAKEAAVASGWGSLHPALLKTIEDVCATIASVPDDALNETKNTLIGPQTVTQLITYPYWNMTYHQGQINYIASLLNRL